MNLVAKNSGHMVNTLDLREMINTERAKANEARVRNDQFLARVEDELGDDLEGVQKYCIPFHGNDVAVYDLTLDQCMLVGMRESKQVRRSVLKKLKAMEAPKPAPALPDFSNPAAAARAWAEEFELKQAAEQALAIAAPKAEFVDKYVEGTGLKGFRQVAKLLKAKEPNFRQFLVDSQIMYRLGKGWTAYANHLEAGRFEMKTGQGENVHDFMDAKFTPKGITWIAGLWAQHKLEIEA